MGYFETLNGHRGAFPADFQTPNSLKDFDHSKIKILLFLFVKEDMAEWQVFEVCQRIDFTIDPRLRVTAWLAVLLWNLKLAKNEHERRSTRKIRTHD